MVFRHGCHVLLLLLAYFTAVGLSAVEEPTGKFPSRVKRSILQFGRMIKCKTGRSAFAYNGYGCYCGLGGKGTPVDGVDKCCQKHDACYGRIQKRKTCRLKIAVYFKVYKTVGCSGCAPRPRNNRCQLAICRCDSAAANCFARNRFHRCHKRYPQSRC